METLVVDARAALLGEDVVPVEDARVLLRAGRVVEAGRRDEVHVPSGAESTDEGDVLLLPGFIDAHVHIGFADPADVLTGGVTTVRDLGWPPAEIWPLVKRSGARDFDGPLIVAAGQMITAPGGYPLKAGWAPADTGRAVATAEDAVAAVDEQARRGAVVVKIALNPPVGPVLSDECLAAVTSEAHRRGLKVTGHIYGLDQFRRALEAGIDELAHMLMSPEVVPDDVLARMADAGVAVVPTLSCRFEDLDVAIDNTRRFREAGGKVVYGTDLGNEGPGPGIDAREIEAMRRAGMSGIEIVRSATVDAAAWLGLDPKGAIAPGRDADLVAVPREALEEPGLLTEVRAVWRGGRRRAGRAA